MMEPVEGASVSFVKFDAELFAELYRLFTVEGVVVV